MGHAVSSHYADIVELRLKTEDPAAVARDCAKAVDASSEAAAAERAEKEAREAELVPLKRIGDLMQSEISRVLEALDEGNVLSIDGYETQMAVAALKTAVDDWTEARRG